MPESRTEGRDGSVRRQKRRDRGAGSAGPVRRQRRSTGGRVCSAAGILLIVAVILLCSLLVLPGMIGFHMYNVLSGSMEPAIPVGSLLYVRSGEPEDVKEKDIIAFYGSLEDSGIITHRVVKNNVVSGTFTTKGDANEKEDPTPVPYDNYIGRVALSLPYAGSVLTMMTSLEGKIAAACVVGLGLLLNVIGGRLGNREAYAGLDEDE
ncbi:MAG: signal peptidase I [Lachnospiraceae bacterium]